MGADRQSINVTMAPPKVSVPTEKAIDVTSYTDDGGGSMDNASGEGHFAMQRSGSGSYIVRTQMSAAPATTTTTTVPPVCTPIWEARYAYNGTYWENNQWHSYDAYDREDVLLFPKDGWEVGFRPTHMRAFFTKDDPGADVGCGLHVWDQSVGYIGPGPSGGTYTSGQSIPLDWDSIIETPKDFHFFFMDIMHNQGVVDFQISGIEFYIGGQWESYFCEEDL